MARPDTPERNPAAPPENVSGYLLSALAAALLPPPAGDTAVAGLLGELLVILRLHEGLRRGVIPPRGSVKVRSRAVADLEAALARAVRRYRDAPSPGRSPSALPAGLENAASRAGADLQAAPPSDQDVINLDTAAALLDLRSRQGASDLVRKHGLTSWRNPGGRHELLVYRAEVIALREQRSGNGTGGSKERPGDPGRSPGDGTARGDRAA